MTSAWSVGRRALWRRPGLSVAQIPRRAVAALVALANFLSILYLLANLVPGSKFGTNLVTFPKIWAKFGSWRSVQCTGFEFGASH